MGLLSGGAALFLRPRSVIRTLETLRPKADELVSRLAGHESVRCSAGSVRGNDVLFRGGAG